MVQKKKGVKIAKKVVHVQVAPIAKKQRRSKVPRPVASAPGSFSAAVRTPFSRAAEGARLPDGNPNMSQTIIVTAKQVLAAQADGTLDAVILPNLYCQMFTTRNSIPNAIQLLCADPTAAIDGEYPPVVTASFRGVGADVGSLSNQFSRYRVVSYGVRLRGTTGVSTQGEFTLAALPLKGLTPMLSSNAPAVENGDDGTLINIYSYWGKSGVRSDVALQLASLGLPIASTGNTAAVDIPKLINLPTHSVVSLAQACARGVHARGLPYESTARDYISTRFLAQGTDSLDVAPDVSAGIFGASQQFGVDMSFARVAGHESVVIGGTGFSAGAVATVEVVYHIEALPNPQYATMYRPSGVVPVVAPKHTLDQSLATLHRIPRFSFADVVQTVGDTMLGDLEGRAGGAAASSISNVAGMLGRMLSVGL